MPTSNTPTFQSLVDMTRFRDQHSNKKTAIRFLDDQLNQQDTLSYSSLDRRARVIAATFQKVHERGERALLLYPPGTEYIACFFGCLYGGVYAVPAYPPQSPREFQRLQTIVKDAGATIICTTSLFAGMLNAWIASSPDLAGVSCYSTDTLDDECIDDWVDPNVTQDDIAFLQYTSGSTGEPKGVMVSHGNLLHNLEQINQCFELTEENQGVIWLPPYHDMGLIGGILQPIYKGFTSTLMSPITFLKRPMRWLETISKHQGTTSGGPNFAYELCAQRATDEQVEALDLSSWSVAFNGAEVIRTDTLDRFVDRFSPCGFKRSSFLPCYGLAEATLIVSGCPASVEPKVLSVKSDSIQSHQIEFSSEADQESSNTSVLVGSGQILDFSLKIVKPDTCELCTEHEIGEIWIQSGSVAQGYWENEALTEEMFNAYTSDSEEGPYMRTGDLGFLDKGELFVTGRLKELIILNGRNYYPVDIEGAAQDCSDDLRRGCGAAFSVDIDGEERLVLVQEIKRSSVDSVNVNQLLIDIRNEIASVHSVIPHDIVLIKHGSLLKTTSGKIRRRPMSDAYLQDQLKVIQTLEDAEKVITKTLSDKKEREAKETAPSLTGADVESAQKGTVDTEEINRVMQLIVSKLAELVGPRALSFEFDVPFVEHGLGSKEAVGLVGELESELGRSLDASLIFNYPTIRALSTFIVSGDEPRDTAPAFESNKGEDEAVAVVGMACRFPGCEDIDGFWDVLSQGVDAIQEVPKDRWDVELFYDPKPATPGKMSSRWGGFIDNVDQFDANFFGISPREAKILDPQQRVLLETAWHALENAGIKPASVRGSDAGVFVGVSSNDYGRLQQGQACSVEAYAGTGNALSIAANRISYFLDLRGPSMAIDTACSSSLVAIHTACENLKRGGCDMALAAGVNLIITPDLHITFSQARMMAADGRCKTFSDDADGYVRGEGCGVLVLKRLSDAKKEGDRIYGVIRGSAVNQDGRSNGITAPNGLSQEQVIRKAVYAAGVSAKDIAYVEAHGTGTPLGDPIEVDALAKVYGHARPKETPLLIGSAKTNIGHLESAAGVAGVIKTLLALHNEEMPGHLHCDSLSTRIPWVETNTQVITANKAWSRGEIPRLAGVSAFGFGGTNSHLILEEAPESEVRKAEGAENKKGTENKKGENSTTREILLLSAKNDRALTSLVKAHESALTDDVTLGSYVQAVNTRRENFNTRAAVIASDVKDMRGNLASLTRDNFHQMPAKKPSVAFLFTGQGAQYWGMGKGLYDSCERFKETLDQCASLLEGQLSIPLLDLIFLEKHADALNQTQYTQPALFSLEYALADLWLSLGVTPHAVIGHSVGEFAAACIAGVFSLEDALTLIVNRGALMQDLNPSGSMLVVQADRAFAEALIEECSQDVSIGAINAEKQTVLSGDTGALERIKERLEADKIKATMLSVSHGFHSPLMRPMVDQFYKIAQSITYNNPKFNVVSNVYGNIANDKITTPEYWRDHVTAPVLFSGGTAELRQAGCNTFIEIGPKPVLIGLTKQNFKSNEPVDSRWIYSLKNGADDRQTMLEAVGDLYVAGYDVNVKNLSPEELVTWIDTPVYPFDRSCHWIEFEEEVNIQATSGEQRRKQSRFTSGEIHPLLGHRIHSPLLNAGEVLYESFLSINSLAALEQQSATNDAVFPPTVFFEMALEAGLELMGTDHLVLDRVDVKAPLKLNESSQRRLQFVVRPETEESFNFSIYSEEPESEKCNESWIKHVDGRVVKSDSEEMSVMERYELHCLETVRLRLDENLVHKIVKEEYLAVARELGFTSKFQALEKLWVGKGEALGQIQIDDNWHADDHVLHPALIDAGIQILWAANAEIDYDFMYSPSGMKRLWMAGKEKLTYSEPIWIHAEIHPQENNELELSADLRVMSPKGELIVVFKNIVLKKVEKVTGLLHKLHGVDYQDGVELLTQHLRGLLAVGLKFSIEEVNVRLPLVDIGMDSLVAMELLNDIESLLGVEINIMKLMEGINTIELAEEILKVLPPAFDDVNLNKTLPSLVEETPYKAAVELAPITDEKNPIFFVHPIGGSVFCYIELAKAMKVGRGFFGLQVPAVADANGEMFSNIPAMAQMYIREIREIQPHGPYCIGGWSMGGVVAYEIAKQLLGEGEKITSLVVVDGLSPTHAKFDGNEDDGFLLKVLALDLGVEERTLNVERLNSGTVLERLDYILDLAKSAELLPSSMKSKDFERRFEIFQANFKALSTYSGEQCEVSLSLIKAETALDQHKDAPDDMGWSDLVGRVNSMELLPGDHFSLIKKPTVTALADILDVLFVKPSTE